MIQMDRWLGGPQGPGFDSYSVQGQWFAGVDSNGNPTQVHEVRPYEFYDNKYEYGGSEQVSTNAIAGYITGIDTSSGTFTIRASISNDTGSGIGQVETMPNFHNEQFGSLEPYVGKMYDVKLTTDFALTHDQQVSNSIWAYNYDQLAWYCRPDTGSFQVPTYDFGDIAESQTVTRDLPFGFDINDAVLIAILQDYMNNGDDVFLNRTTSLKISNYPDGLATDDGSDYPTSALLSSDVSVFFNTVPIPGAFWLFGSALTALACIRRKLFK